MARTRVLEIETPKMGQKELMDQLDIKQLLKRSKKMSKSHISNHKNLMETIKSSPQKRRKLNDDTNCFPLERTISFAYLGLMPTPSSKAQSAQKTDSSEAPESKETEDRTKTEDEETFAKPKIIECDYCMKIFFSRIVYRRHALKHVKIIRCARCNKPYKHIRSHRRHERNCGKHYRI